MTRNRTAYVLLGLLSIEPNQSGYDLRKAIESSVGYFWGESYGQIYPTLKRLAAGGRGPDRQEQVCLRTQAAAPGVLADRCRPRLPARVAGPALPERSAPQ